MGAPACPSPATLPRPAKRHTRLLASMAASALLLMALAGMARRRAAAAQHGVPLELPAPLVHKQPATPPACAGADQGAEIQGCLAVSQVCVDQGEVVLMGEEYQASALRPEWQPGAVAPLPRFEPDVQYTKQFGQTGSNGDFYTSSQPQIEPVPFRARSWLDASPDLQQPQFDNSTIPVVLHLAWMFNYAHSATAGLAWVFNNINQTSNPVLAERARLIIRTPHGWAMPPFMRPLFQPLLRRPVATFAELSQRPAPGSAAAAPGCFCRMLICNSYNHTFTPNAWSAAQAVAASYLPPAPPATPQQQGEEQPLAAAPSPPQQEQPAVRRIVFHRRSTQIRQFVNLPELLDRCSRWDWVAAEAAGGSAAGPAAGGRQKARVECSAHTFTDLADSVAAAHAADVFIGTHGANIANGFFMRPGSALVEVMHPSWAHTFHAMLDQDAHHQLMYFGLVVDEKAWRAGAFEEQQRKAGLEPYSNGSPLGRDRNVRLRWEWLEPVLGRIAALNGSVAAWRQLAMEEIVMHVG